MKKIILFIIIVSVFISLNLFSLDPRYHTYEEIKAEIDSLQALYPDWVLVDSIGVTLGAPYQEPIPIWAVKISDNVTLDEDEPAVLYVGQCHAEEVLGVEITMYMINDILEHFYMSPYSIWLSELEMWFIPSINPEGLQVVMDDWDTSFRKNKRDCNQNGTFIDSIDYVPGPGYDRDGVDLNRNYAFNWIHGDTLWAPGGEELWDYYRGPAPFSEGGTRAVRNLAEEQHFIFSINWHSSRSGNYCEKVKYSYNWNVSGKHPPDFAVNQMVGETVAGLIEKESGGGYYEPGPSQGRVGIAHDWFYQAYGTTQLLIECGTDNIQPPPWVVDDTCERCSVGAYWLLSRSINGYLDYSSMLTGHITDSLSGQPLVAEVIVEEKYASYFAARLSDELYGRFWRVLMPGTYDLIIRKKGYEEKFINDVTVNNSCWTNLNIELVPLGLVEVSGTVTCNGNPVPAQIIVYDIENDTIYTENGGFAFITYEGEHKIQVTSEGCVPCIDTIEFIPGFYDMNVVLSPEVVLFSEDWESGFSNWEVAGEWAIEFDIFDSSNVATNNPDLVSCDFYKFYSNNSSSILTTLNPINLNGVDDDVVLSFYQKYYTEHDKDFCYVEISIDGTYWDELVKFSGINKAWNFAINPYMNRNIISLEDYINNQIYLRFRFESDDTITDPGWWLDNIRITASTGHSAGDEPPSIQTKLHQNYPNPFSSSTTISFNLATNYTNLHEQARIRIYNIKGQLVRTFRIPNPESRTPNIVWDGKDENNNPVSSGIYFYKLKVGDKVIDTKKCLILK